MTKKMLNFLSHNFCISCCGKQKKDVCDCINKTCDRVAEFLVECNSYKEEINEEELDRLAMQEAVDMAIPKSWRKEFVFTLGFKAGYKLAKSE